MERSSYHQLLKIFDHQAIMVDKNLNILDINQAALAYFNISYVCALKSKLSQFIPENIINFAISEVANSKELVSFAVSNDLNIRSEWFIVKVEHHKEPAYLLIDGKESDSRFIKMDDTLRVIEEISERMPGNYYWKNIQGTYLGCNSSLLKTLGFSSKQDIIGKTDYTLWPEQADELRKNDLYVMETGKSLEQEEIALLPNGDKGYFAAVKIPMRDRAGKTIGIIGNSLDITPQKEAEKLKLENAAVVYKAELEAQAKFTKNVYSVVHDIRSPISTLMMIVRNCKDIPEDSRIALREIAVSIGDIANNLLSKYGGKEKEDNIEERKPLLLSAILLHLISDKKHQYKELDHIFEYDCTQAGQLAFINIQKSSFKRMISNLINNAVDAFDGKKGEVIVKLDAADDKVFVMISDNGKGIPKHVKEKILQNIAVTEGKVEGHGLGLTQVSETLSRNEGKMTIDSQLNQGTQIKLTFPRIEAPNWIAEEIRIRPDDTVVILDDDKSIHMAWDIRFEDLLKQYPQVKIKHFENCHDAIQCIESFSEEEKEKVYLLTDFELLKQELNGLHVVERTKIKRSILVTSHYADSVLLNRASHIGTKVLPKQLAPEISIIVDETKNLILGSSSVCVKKRKEVDAILVDDDKRFADTLIKYIFGDNEIDYFEDPHEFMEKIKDYRKDTRIYLDNNYRSAGVTGFTLAKELHELGYNKLYLLTGDTFQSGTTPDYIKVIRKDDIDSIKDW